MSATRKWSTTLTSLIKAKNPMLPKLTSRKAISPASKVITTRVISPVRVAISPVIRVVTNPAISSDRVVISPDISNATNSLRPLVSRMLILKATL